jgi:hypothetical protein
LSYFLYVNVLDILIKSDAGFTLGGFCPGGNFTVAARENLLVYTVGCQNTVNQSTTIEQAGYINEVY